MKFFSLDLLAARREMKNTTNCTNRNGLDLH